ncbi:MAG: glycoside hydrolase family 5 protein, partial [Oscillospiraceae bacterium]|nr:glycoside hydrolase family 5 protein [Oscillospiraceae bacterium]
MKKTIGLHPENPKIFEYNGKPVMLFTATEHYGAVMNRPFDYLKYLEDMRKKRINYTRLFVLFRELQVPTNPYSTCKPESPDYISPYRRTGPGKACDGEPKYDLNQWNDEFFFRLHEFLSTAEKYDIIVEVTLFSNTYTPMVWSCNPLHAANNLSNLKDIDIVDYNTLRDPQRTAVMERLAEKIVRETNKYTNIMYEICNEPGGDNPNHPNSPTCAESNAWVGHMIKLVRSIESKMENVHLITGEEAYTYVPAFATLTDESFDNMDFDVVTVHPTNSTVISGKWYLLGGFMSRELNLENYRDFCLEGYKKKKPMCMDEDNAASAYKDECGWTIHRKRAWTTIFCGAHYDYIDFSILPRLEAGTPESQKHIRAWMGYLADYLDVVDLVNVRPAADIIVSAPSGVVGSVLADQSDGYHIYLADAAEYDSPEYGRIIAEQEIVLDLKEGEYKIDAYSPATGMFSPACAVRLGNGASLRLPCFCHD